MPRFTLCALALILATHLSAPSLHAQRGTALAGDVVGPTSGNTVTRIQGRPVSSTAPSLNQAMIWTGAAWGPANQSGGGGSSQYLTGVSSGPTATYTIGTAPVTITAATVTLSADDQTHGSAFEVAWLFTVSTTSTASWTYTPYIGGRRATNVTAVTQQASDKFVVGGYAVEFEVTDSGARRYWELVNTFGKAASGGARSHSIAVFPTMWRWDSPVPVDGTLVELTVVAPNDNPGNILYFERYRWRKLRP